LHGSAEVIARRYLFGISILEKESAFLTEQSRRMFPELEERLLTPQRL
jgi:hypothetical protein